MGNKGAPMNAKAKGARRDRQARDLLYQWGALRVVKSGASLDRV